MRGVQDDGIGAGAGRETADVGARRAAAPPRVAASNASSMVSPHSRTASARARGIDVE